jgi:pimeloyl-ACP methyl ester carboxylesterase
MVFLIIAGVFLLLVLLAGFYFASLVIYPRVFPYEKTYQIEVEKGKIIPEEYNNWPKEEFSLTSPHGYQLHCLYFPVEGSKKTIIISHGVTYTLYGSIKYLPLFYKRGFNVLLYDLRNHGKSDRLNTTFGVEEKFDLKALVDWVVLHNGPDEIIGTMGESLGAAITLQHAGIDSRITFAVSDCSFSNLPDLLKYRLHEEYRLPPFPMLPVSDLFCYTLAGWHYEQSSPISAVMTTATPIFFIHGQEDKYIPPEMSQAMFEAKKHGYRKLYLAPNADHAQSLWQNRQDYDQQIEAFLRDIKVL